MRRRGNRRYGPLVGEGRNRTLTVIANETRTAHNVLSDELISACGKRAAVYDRENRFFTEDFEALRAAGYLNVLVPPDLGGLGLSVSEVCKEQERLAYRAPPAALAINMHPVLGRDRPHPA